MKKILIVLMGALTLGVTARAAVGDRFTAGDLKYQVLNEEAKTASVEGYVGTPSEVAIPETANGYTIVRIGGLAFQRCTSLTSVEIPNSVIEIASAAFSSCTNLATITIPESVTEIGESVFDGCSSLTSVAIPNSVTKISSDLFRDCSNLASVTISESLTEICFSAFNGCSSLISVVLPASLTEIGDYAFYECNKLANIYCYAVNPPELSIGVFEDLEVSKIALHVLEDAVATYKGARVWKDFNIVGDLTAEAGIDGVEADGYGAAAEYFNLGGVRVNADSLAPGLYIKRQGGKAEKVLVK